MDNQYDLFEALQDDIPFETGFERFTREEAFSILEETEREEREEAEWLAQFGTPIIDSSTTLTPEEQKLADSFLSSIVGIDDVKDDPAAVIIPGFVIAGERTVVCGKAGHGKSSLSYKMAHCIAHGEDFLGFKASPRKVIYLDRENQIAGLRNFRDWLGIRDRSKKNPDSNLLIYGIQSPNGVPQVNDGGLLAYCKAQMPRPVVFVDTFVAFMDGHNENDSSEVRAWWNLTEKLRKLGCAVIVLHHTGKGETSSEFRGSTDIKNAADRFFTFQKFIPKGASEDCPLTRFKLERTKCRLAHPEFSGKTSVDVSKDGIFTFSAKRKLSLLEKILIDNPGITQTDFIEEAAMSDIPKNKALAFLNDKALVKAKKGKTGNTCNYWLIYQD